MSSTMFVVCSQLLTSLFYNVPIRVTPVEILEISRGSFCSSCVILSLTQVSLPKQYNTMLCSLNKIYLLALSVFTTKSYKNMPISFAMSICPHVRTWEWLNRFLWNLVLGSYAKTCLHIQFSLKLDNNNRHFIWRPTCIFAHGSDSVRNLQTTLVTMVTVVVMDTWGIPRQLWCH
jgi:hypothetical protein